MPITAHNPPDVFPPYLCYAHAVEVSADARTLYVSGLNGFEQDGTTMPPSFEAQAELVWQHLERVLPAAAMTFADLVSLRFYLADPLPLRRSRAVARHRGRPAWASVGRRPENARR